jgi:hypothetical protein
VGAAYLKGPSQPPKTACEGKRKFDTKLDAEHCARVRMRAGAAEKTLALWVYKCRDCRNWHLTSSPQKDGKPITGE